MVDPGFGITLESFTRSYSCARGARIIIVKGSTEGTEGKLTYLWKVALEVAGREELAVLAWMAAMENHDMRIHQPAAGSRLMRREEADREIQLAAILNGRAVSVHVQTLCLLKKIYFTVRMYANSHHCTLQPCERQERRGTYRAVGPGWQSAPASLISMFVALRG